MKEVISSQDNDRRKRFWAIAVHCYTASGGVIGFLALVATADHNFRLAFLLLFLAIMIDYSDGTIARAMRTQDTLSIFDGDKLDTIVDFLNDAIVPVFLLWEAKRFPRPELLWAATMIIISALRFMKTDQPLIEKGRFRGLPALWLFPAFYMFFFPVPPAIIAIVIIAVAALSFSSLGFIHLARSGGHHLISYIVLGIWWLAYVLITQDLTKNKRYWVAASLLFPAYYLCTPWLFRRSQDRSFDIRPPGTR